MQNDRIGINFHFGLLTSYHIGHFYGPMKQKTVKELLGRWPSRTAVLQDVSGANPSLRLVAVHRWIQRNAIPSQYWLALLDGAKRRNISLSAIELVAVHACPDADSDVTDQEDAA